MAKTLTAQDIVAAARQYDLEPALLIAITEVESGGNGFLPDGRVKILLERHVLWQRLQARGIDPRPLATDLPGLCGKSWAPKSYPYGSQLAQYDRLARVVGWASAHDAARWESYKKAAYEACSWGLFQVMGYHYQACGFPDVYALKHAFEASEAAHLTAILAWMTGNGLLKKLRKKDWRGFVRGYNGAGQVDRYTAKLQAAYDAALR